jgi:hypothetical protein
MRSQVDGRSGCRASQNDHRAFEIVGGRRVSDLQSALRNPTLAHAPPQLRFQVPKIFSIRIERGSRSSSMPSVVAKCRRSDDPDARQYDLGPLSGSAKREPAWPPLCLFKALLLAVWYDLFKRQARRSLRRSRVASAVLQLLGL